MLISAPCRGHQGLSGAESAETPASADIRAAIFGPEAPDAVEPVLVRMVETLVNYNLVMDRGCSTGASKESHVRAQVVLVWANGHVGSNYRLLLPAQFLIDNLPWRPHPMQTYKPTKSAMRST